MNNPLRALIVEDSKFDAEFIMRALRETGYELSASAVVDDPVEFEEALSKQAWDIVISDYVMPTFNGTEALEVFQRHKLDIPFICVSGGIGEELAKLFAANAPEGEHPLFTHLLPLPVGVGITVYVLTTALVVVGLRELKASREDDGAAPT